MITRRRAFQKPIVLVTLALVACGAERPDEPVVESMPAGEWLVEVTAAAGLDFVQRSGASGDYRLPEIMAAGAGLFDHDGDGDLDLYLTSGTSSNRLFSQEASGRFVDVTSRSGLGDAGYGMGLAVGDVDNDGDPDVYLTNVGPDRLYANRGDGTFLDVSERAGIAVDGWSTSAVFVDYDRDGWLDLFVARYVQYDPSKACTDAAGRPDYCTPAAFPAQADVLLLNRGDGTFEDRSLSAGIQTAVGPGLGVAAEDIDDDGWPDLYVANDGAANHVWINAGDGTFRDEGLILGAAYNVEGRAEAGMGVVAADLDNDAHTDLFLTHLGGETHTLYRSRGPSEGFDDATGSAGLSVPSTADTGFGVAAIDLELDGDLDLVIANGRVTRGAARPESVLPWDEFAEANRVFLNDGTGRFEPAGSVVKGFTSTLEVSRALAVGDVDDDGDLDLLLNNVEGPARLYVNRSPRRGGWLSVRAVDPRKKRFDIGARVTLVAGERRRTRTVSRGGGYLSSADPRIHFGAVAAGPGRLEVRWSDGVLEGFELEGRDREVTLRRGEGQIP